MVSYDINAGGIAMIGLLITVCAIAIILTWDYAFGSSEFLSNVKTCTDIYQETNNTELYYRCMNPLTMSTELQ